MRASLNLRHFIGLVGLCLYKGYIGYIDFVNLTQVGLYHRIRTCEFKRKVQTLMSFCEIYVV